MRKKIIITLFAFACQLKALEGNKNHKIIDQNCDYVDVKDFKPCDLEPGFNEAFFKDLKGYEEYEAERVGCVRKALKAVQEKACGARKRVSEGWGSATRKLDKCVSSFFNYAAYGVVKFGDFALNAVDRLI